MDDLKPIVANSYLAIIKGTLNRVLYFENDTILNHLLRLHINIDTGEENGHVLNADEELLITDKFFIFKALWKAVLETLYSEHLPHIDYSFDWKIETTPYTLMMCEFTKDYQNYKDMEKMKELLKINDEEIETNYHQIINDLGFPSLGITVGLSDLIPAHLVPSSRIDELQLLFRLMSFPPLGELALFQNQYNAFIKKQAEKLSSAFSGIIPDKIPSFGMPESLHCSYFHIHHETYKKHGLHGFEQNPILIENIDEFQDIRNKVAVHKEKFNDTLICPCCGEKQTIDLPEEILHYKYLLENRDLAKKIGLAYFEDFVEDYKNNMADKLHSFIPNINKVDNPECLILVEGESEEWAIPLLAFRKRFILSQSNIQVYNSKSKEKLAADFFSFRTNYPNRKMICLLDADAKKERDNLERIINNNKDKYRLVFIENGTFEDIFELDISIDILNELYPDGDQILRSDFIDGKDFLSNIKRIMFEKKKAQFDKVLFAKTTALKMDIDKLPKEVANILAIAEDFVKPRNFIKQ
ncbi:MULTISPECIES: OLD family protein [Bacteroidota]|uniref:Uncharacterized protein n=1 Tax=Sphingobacterium multivorum TaxID=28454 RepID=A0A653ZP97_SPHMU|nr:MULTISPECIES: hypothetical protein [Bacteroidota]VXC57046.1 conserved hypothetical protein [Sphingobacterium multivorum]